MISKLFSGSGTIAKFIVALFGAASTDLTIYYGGSHWVPIVTSVLSAVGVYLVPNTPSGPNNQPPAAA